MRPGGRWLGRFHDRYVWVPALILDLEVLDGHRVSVSVQVGQRPVLADPASVDVVADRELARLVEDVEDQVLAEARERHLAAGRRIRGPRPEVGIVGDASL